MKRKKGWELRAFSALLAFLLIGTVIGDTVLADNEKENIPQVTSITESPKEAFYYGNDATTVGGIIIGSYDSTKDPLYPNVIIPDTIDGKPVTAISNNAFYQMKLKSVKIPDTVNMIYSSAFRENELERANLPKELVFLGDMSFYKNKLKTITIPGKVGTGKNGRWDKYAFANNQLESVILEEGLESLGVAPFINNKITSIKFPSTLKSISYQAFAGNSLMEIDIPNTVSTIEGQAFLGNGILSPNIPNSVINLDTDSFDQQGRIVKGILKGETLTYKLPDNIDASKITLTTPDVNIDRVTKTISCPKTLKEIKYNYLLGNFGGNEKYLTATLQFVPKLEATFVDYNDNVLEKIVVDINGTASPTVKPSRPGYTFIGWDNPLNNLTDSVIFKAQYKSLPKVTSDDVTLKLNSDFNPKSNIKAIDADGNAISPDMIIITNNSVNPKEPGTYKVSYKVTDSWGGVVLGSYEVIVQKSMEDKILTDTNTGITTEGTFDDKSQLIVKVVPIKNNVLQGETIGKDVVGSYDAYIIGKFDGRITVTFPINQIYNGRKIYISHQKHDKTIERFERIAADGKVSVTVDELSPFTLTVDKQVIIKPDNPKSSEKSNEVKTEDSTNNIGILVLLLTVSTVFVRQCIVRKKDN